MTREEAREKISEEDYKLSEEVIKPIYYNSIKKDYSFARYGVDCYRAGYNKANEWHYVKDELPPIKKEYCGRSELVLVLSKEKEMQYAQYVEKEKTWARGICEINFKPYAWKEIVLPELPKEIKENE